MINLKDFNCDENLEQYVDSMLFDSGTVIASANYEDDNYIITIDLQVVGAVFIEYKGQEYHNPSEFPDELRKKIKFASKWYSDNMSFLISDLESDELHIHDSNWFEYIYTVRGKNNNINYSDGEMADDIAYANAGIIEDDMQSTIKNILYNLIDK